MINITNFTCEDNPPEPRPRPVRPAWPAPPAQRAGSSRRRVRAISGRIVPAAGLAVAVLLSWLAFVPRRLGDHLFAGNDTEAYWHGWQITKVHGGLGRRYRDPLFGTLAACPTCQGSAAGEGVPCVPCLGTGRVSTGGVS